jgi:hypothetical protein
MLLFGVSKKDAAGFTLANHAIQIFPVIIMGLISAVIAGVDIRRVLYNREKEPSSKLNQKEILHVNS